MDRHDIPGVTARAIAENHQKDLEIQDEYSCNCLTYWVDEERENVFCLIDAPDISSVKDLHRRSHGLIPHGIVEVDGNLVKAFLGRIHDPISEVGIGKSELSIFNDPAFRALVVADLKEKAFFGCKYGKEVRNELTKRFNQQVEEAIQEHKGSLVEKHDEFLISFTSVTNAVEFSLRLQNLIESQNSSSSLPKVELQIGISAGVPVAESKSLFGDAVKMAKTLSFISNSCFIKTSSVIRQLYKGGMPHLFDSSGPLITLSTDEEHFIKSLVHVIQDSLADETFNIARFSREIGVSNSQLYRKTVHLTGFSPNDFFKEVRLTESAKLLQNKTVTETSYVLGFTNPSYFTKCFKKRFNVLPLDYCKSLS
jgi:AraC-like DNA-binding protein